MKKLVSLFSAFAFMIFLGVNADFAMAEGSSGADDEMHKPPGPEGGGSGSLDDAIDDQCREFTNSSCWVTYTTPKGRDGQYRAFNYDEKAGG